MNARIRTLVRAPWCWGLVGIVLLLAINTIKDPTYLAIGINPTTGLLAGNVLDILRVSSPIIMIALGMTFVIATSGIDLSVGSIMAVGGAVAMVTLSEIGQAESFGAMAAAIGLAVLLGAVLGSINGLLVSVVGLQPFISTLVMMLAARGIARVITGGQNTNATNGPFKQIANGQFFGLPISFVVAIALVIIVALIMRRTALGLMIEAIGINPRASRLAGIRPKPILITVYVLAAALAAIGGLFTVSEVMTVDVSGTGYQMELDAILAVVVGGTSLAGGKFSIFGSVVGAVLIATLDKTVIFLGVSAAATPAFKAIVIVVLVLLQSDRIRELISSRAGRTKPPGAATPALAPTTKEVGA